MLKVLYHGGGYVDTVLLEIDKNGEDYEQYIDVSSLNTEESGNIVIIKPLCLLWGCLGKDTIIQMEDGSAKKISDISVGERVAQPEGSAAVSDIWQGPAEEIYHIKPDSDREILATGDYQFKTENGYVRVLDLTSDTRLLTSEGGTMRVFYCYAESCQDNVYNLDNQMGQKEEMEQKNQIEQ